MDKMIWFGGVSDKYFVGYWTNDLAWWDVR